MRILCCLNRDLASSIALNLLLPEFGTHTVCIGLTERVGSTPQLLEDPPERRALRIFEQSLPIGVLFPLIERAGLPDCGKRYLTFHEVERYRNIPIISLPNPNAPEALETIRHFAPDVILTIRYGAILKPSVIAIPPLGVLNLHSGLLPAYRGVLATFRALLNGDDTIGCTLHQITDGTIDTGAIVSTATVPVVPEHSLLWHILALYPPGVALIGAALAQLENGLPLATHVQPRMGCAYYSAPSTAEWTALTQLGWGIMYPDEFEDILKRYTIGLGVLL